MSAASLPDGEHVGCCGLRPHDPSRRIYELGVHIRSSWWRRGLAEEAAAAVIRHAFDNLGAAALFAGHNPNNHASQHVSESRSHNSRQRKPSKKRSITAAILRQKGTNARLYRSTTSR